MFCPLCKAEYREGFTRCNDCDVDLVASLTTGAEPAISPDKTTNSSHYLAWFLPMLGLFALIVLFAWDAGSKQNPATDFLLFFIWLCMSVTQLGTLWMLYQSVRYEERPFRYCILALVPFMFAWYYLERYKRREGMSRIPAAFR